MLNEKTKKFDINNFSEKFDELFTIYMISTPNNPIYYDLQTNRIIYFPVDNDDTTDLSPEEQAFVKNEIYDHPDRYLILPYSSSKNDDFELMVAFAREYHDIDLKKHDIMINALDGEYPMHNFKKVVSELKLDCEWSIYVATNQENRLDNWISENHIPYKK